MRRESLYRSLTIATPIVAFLSATGASAYEWQRLKRLEMDTTSTERKIAGIDRELRTYEAQPQTAKYPTVAKTPREQAQFLDALRANADTCKVQIVRWSNNTAPPVAAGSTAPSDGSKPAPVLPAGVTAIVSLVEVSGGTDNTRQFLYNVARSRRLLNMTDLKWVRDKWPNTHLTFTLTRYVAPPVELPDVPGRAIHPGAETRATPRPTAGGQSPAGNEPAATVGPSGPGGITLPNPMDAPGITHNSYQSNLESNFSQLNQMNPSPTPASPRPPAVTNTKR
jgi:hypothetical protein